MMMPRVVCDRRYPHPEGGSWLKLIYVPASCTHKCQPADVGLVVAVKAGVSGSSILCYDEIDEHNYSDMRVICSIMKARDSTTHYNDAYNRVGDNFVVAVCRRMFQLMVACMVSSMLAMGVEPSNVTLKFDAKTVKPQILDGFAKGIASIKQEDGLHYFEKTRINTVPETINMDTASLIFTRGDRECAHVPFVRLPSRSTFVGFFNRRHSTTHWGVRPFDSTLMASYSAGTASKMGNCGYVLYMQAIVTPLVSP